MDDIIGSLVREAGKQYAEAQKRAAAEAARRAPPPPPPPPEPQRLSGITPPTVLAPPPPTPLTSMPTSAARPIAAAADGSDADPLVAPRLPGVPMPRADAHLLTAFRSTSGLLAGIVLSEALAPPVALRDAQLFDRIER